MASRVNVKFVVLLAVLVAVVFVGVAGVFAFVKMRSGDRYLRLGEEAMARQDYNAADSFLARAVASEPGNVQWLTKWRHAREKKIPEGYPAYEQDYAMYVMGILRSLATLQRTNVDAHREYLEALYRERALGATRDAWEMLVREVDFSLAFFEPDEPASLRRYRGLAVAAMQEMGLRVPDELVQKAREDLEASLREKPADPLAARELAGWHIIAAQAARARDDRERESQHLATARRVLADLLRAAPEHPLAIVEQLVMDASEVERMEDSSRDPAEVVRAKMRALDELRPRVAEVHRRLMESEPSALDFTVIVRFFNVAARVDPPNGAPMTLALVNRALEHNPLAADMLSIRANTTLMLGDFDGALAQFERLAELPNLPISLEGLRLWEIRRRARFLQANVAATAAVQASDTAGRDAALKRARDYRRQLVAIMPERSPEMLYIDGKLMFADGDLSGAQRTLDEFVRSPGSAIEQVPDALVMLADCALRRESPGRAREYLQQIHRMRPNAPEVLMALARVEAALQNHREAEAVYLQILELNPDHEGARQQLEILQAMRRERTVADPVLQRIIEADRLARGDETRLGDEDAAIQMLQRALGQHAHNPRLVTALVQLLLMRNDRDGALAVIQQALERHPQDATLLSLNRQAQAVGSMELTLALINESDAPPLEKALGRQRVYLLNGREAEAKAELEEAARLAPDDARVVEQQFVSAVQRGDLNQAAALAERAARLDIDRADGDTFRARLQLAQGNARQAVITLQRAADRGNATAPLLRLLGLTQLQLGRAAEAISTLRRALDVSPTDLTSIKTLISALVQNNLMQDALTVARNAENHARRDPEFLNMWLSLEAASGNTQMARERREQIFARNPDDRDNVAALAELYIGEKRWDRARQMIDRIRGSGSLRGVVLDARWHADRGDLERARQVFVDHIASLQRGSTPMGPEPYMTFGQFMIQRGQVNVGIEAMRQAVQYQDPRTRSVEIAIGDVLLSLGRLEDAEKAYRAVLDAGIADTNNQIRKRLIEAQVQQHRYAEADREFQSLPSGADEDIEILALRAEVARGLGDARRSREMLDRAVARHPEEPLGYVRRARLLMGEPEFARDAIADLTTALRLRPGMWQAYRLRAMIHFAEGRTEEALRDIVAGVEANPNMDELRFDAISRLLRNNREPRALEIAEAGARLRPADSRLMVQLGDVFARNSRWGPASRFYKRAWEISADETGAIRYVGALINANERGQRNDPQLAEAQQVLAQASLGTERSLNLLMLRAAVRHRQGREDQARADSLQAYSLIGEDPRQLMVWGERLRVVYPTVGGALAVLNATQPAPSLADWQRFMAAMFMADEPTMRDEGISALRSVAASAGNVAIQGNALKALSSKLTESELWEDAYQVTRQGLALMNDDVMLNNNAAFFLVDKLGRPGEGLPYAERAVALDPENRAVLDTLASAQWAVGDRQKAIATLTRALRASRTEADRASTALKLGKWKLAAGDRTGAIGMAQLARDIVSEMVDTTKLRPELDGLLRDIGQGR